MSISGPKTTPIHNSNIGPKTTPTNHGTRERQRQGAAFATRKDTSASKIKIIRARLWAESSNSQTTFLKKLHEGENWRWKLSFASTPPSPAKRCHCVCIHHEASDLLNRPSVTLQVSRVQASECMPWIFTFCENLHEVNNKFWGIRKHGTDKKSSQRSGSVAADAGNQQRRISMYKISGFWCREPKSTTSGQEGKLRKKLARYAFPFGSGGTSSANSLSSGSSRVSIPRFVRFREDLNLGSWINFQRKPRRTNSSQGAPFVTTPPNCVAEWHQRIIVPH